jgi:ubiquinone biosynthesis protein UbiJ
MGRNKHIRTLIAGQLRTITRHQRKIAEEIAKPSPNVGYIRSWEREIDNAREKVRKLEERLGK